MVDIRYSAKEGFDVATENNNFIILNTTLTKALIEEGIARELISKVQNLRKERDFNIVDRIELFYNADSEVEETINNFMEFIKGETLSVSITKLDELKSNVDLNGHEVAIDVKVVR
jgi:isoleucyl-tRNA synthetase